MSYRSSHRRCFIKKLFLEVPQYSQENTCLFSKVAVLHAFWPSSLKKIATQGFSCKYCKTFKNTYFKEHLRRTACELKRHQLLDSHILVLARQKQSPEVFLCKKVFLEISQNSQKSPCEYYLLKKRLWHRFFPVNFVKFLRAPFLQNTSGRLLLRRTVK